MKPIKNGKHSKKEKRISYKDALAVIRQRMEGQKVKGQIPTSPRPVHAR
jgi:hypothetical protein